MVYYYTSNLVASTTKKKATSGEVDEVENERQ